MPIAVIVTFQTSGRRETFTRPDRLRAQARAATATVAASLGSRVVLDVEQGLPVAFTPR